MKRDQEIIPFGIRTPTGTTQTTDRTGPAGPQDGIARQDEPAWLSRGLAYCQAE
jgi:hypothetical protein